MRNKHGAGEGGKELVGSEWLWEGSHSRSYQLKCHGPRQGLEGGVLAS